MKKIESLNNAQKTVLQLEKEINAISNNLSKVKNKDHTTMKKIINNINYLLKKDAYEANLYKNVINETKEESKKEEDKGQRNKIDTNFEYNLKNNNKIDYLLVLNKQKNINNRDKNSTKPYFNRKCLSSSKINTNNFSYEKKYFQEYHNNKDLPVKDISNRNRIINNSNNIIKTNMTYSKPRLLTEYSKRNSNNNITFKNNTFNKNGGSAGQIKNIKYLTLNEKANNSCKNNRHKKSSILSTLYYNYKDNTENNNFLKNNYLKENSKNKIAFSFEQPEVINKQKEKDIKNFLNDNEEIKHDQYEYGKILGSTNKKNKILISERKMKNNPNILLNSNNTNNKNNFYNNINLNNAYSDKDYLGLSKKEEDLSKNSINDKKIKYEKDNYIFSYGHQNVKNLHNDIIHNNDIEKNFNTWDNYKKHRIRTDSNNYINPNISKSLNSKNIINNSNFKKRKNKKINIDNITSDKDKIDILLNMLNVTNINEGIMKVNNLLKNDKDINQLKELFKNGNNEELKFDKNNIWLSNVAKEFRRNEKYKHFCKNIMISYNIKNFEDFKIFINSNLPKNKNNKEYYNGKKICLDDKYYINENINIMNNNDKLNFNEHKKITEENEKDKYSHNSEDINFSNVQNFKVITDYMQTYY